MKANDSRERHNRHSFEATDFEHQSDRAREKMQPVATGEYFGDGEIYTDCHMGVAQSA
jgi:nitrate/TMAO reductase-like tetraheme cytochrome c subunit